MTASKQKLNLSDDKVYYGQEANKEYMSVSQFKDFLDCEARALATVRGEYKPPKDVKPLLVGNYVHSYFESPEAHEKFKKENKDLLFKEPTVNQIKQRLKILGLGFKGATRKQELMDLLPDSIDLYGDMYAEFKQAETLVQRVEEEEFFRFLWQGEKEKVITGQAFGTEWKGKVDLLNVEEGYFVDLKTARGLDTKIWTYAPTESRDRYVSFIEAYGYVYQVMLYEMLLSEMYDKPFVGYLYVVTKEDKPNVAAIDIDADIKEAYHDEMHGSIDRVLAVKSGKEEPIRCERCDYCKEGKQLKGFTMLSELVK